MNKERRQAEVFKALSDETRLRIVNLLLTAPHCVCEMVAMLNVPQYKISKHLILLKYAGLVECKRQGTWAHYSLRKKDPSLQSLFRFLKKSGRARPTGLRNEPVQHSPAGSP